MKTIPLSFQSFRALQVAILTLLAIELAGTPQARAQIYSDVIGDLSNSRAAIDFGNPSYGYAQEFTITSGYWAIFQAQMNLGDGNDLPGSPLLQVRNSLGAGSGPGTQILGSFTMNPGDIPTGFNFANVVAPANNIFVLGPGTYWLCWGNDQPVGGPWIAFASSVSLAQSGIAGTVNTTPAAQSGDGGQTFGAPSLGGYALLIELDGQAVPEPSVKTLLTVGLLLTAFMRFRKHTPAQHRAACPP